MPDEKENLDEGQVQPLQEATDEALTLEQLASKKPEELLEIYNNSREAIKAATQRNMETAEERKRFEAERDYLLSEGQRKDDELKRAYDQITQWSTTLQKTGQPAQPSPRNYDELTPEQAYAQTLEGQRKIQEEIANLKKMQEQNTYELRGEVEKTQRAIEYRDFLKEKILPNYKYVTQRSIDDWFTDHPNIDPNPKTVQLAAEEINKRENDRFEVEVQARLKERAKKAEEVPIVGEGSPLTSLPDGKKMIDLSPAEQEEVLRRDVEKLQKK
jgi:hypothetical protein